MLETRELLSKVYNKNPVFFARGNSTFFGDTYYRVIMSGDNIYLLRKTSMFSDMFGQPKKYFYRINEIDPITLKIGRLIDDIFQTKDAALKWIEYHCD